MLNIMSLILVSGVKSLFLHLVRMNVTCVMCAGICQLGLEPEQHAGAGAVGADAHQRRHQRHESALAVRGHVLLVLLLAHRGPLELLHQLPALVSPERSSA